MSLFGRDFLAPDEVSAFSLRGLWVLLTHMIRSVLKRPLPVVLPEDLPAREGVPDYLKQNFHGLPNGYFSHKVPSTYHLGFELAMIGTVGELRAWQSQQFAQCASFLDVGCGGGSLAIAVRLLGVTDVWGLDPSPYALPVAAHQLSTRHTRAVN